MLRKPARRHPPKAEMNVVPYIDVMLVLLVIFMVTAPMLTQGVKIELPREAAQPLPEDATRRMLTLSVPADGGYHWKIRSASTAAQTGASEGSARTVDDMVTQVHALVSASSGMQVYIRADQDAPYGRVVAAMAALQRGGVDSLGLITEQPETATTP